MSSANMTVGDMLDMMKDLPRNMPVCFLSQSCVVTDIQKTDARVTSQTPSGLGYGAGRTIFTINTKKIDTQKDVKKTAWEDLPYIPRSLGASDPGFWTKDEEIFNEMAGGI
jgi:hypothetical protein